jgi:hypothetical protein
MPLSVSTVWIWSGKAATTFLRKAAPSIFPALSWNSTSVNFETRSIVRQHDQLAVGVAQFAAVDVHVADLVGLEALALVGRLRCRQTRDAVTLQAAMQSASAEAGDGVAQAAQDIVERQQGPAPELHDDRFLGGRQNRALGRLGSHSGIAGHAPAAPFGDRLRVQPVEGGKGPATRLRRLELGSNTRRRAGAAVKNPCHRASSS